MLKSEFLDELIAIAKTKSAVVILFSHAQLIFLLHSSVFMSAVNETDLWICNTNTGALITV